MGWLMTIIGVPPPKANKKSTRYRKKKETQQESKFGNDQGKAELYLPTEYKIVCENNNYAELESLLHVTSVTADYSTRLPTHPLENGMVKHDHKIVEPKRYTVVAYVKANDYSFTRDKTDNARAMKCTKLLDELTRSSDLNAFIRVYSPMMEKEMSEPKKEKCLKLYLNSYKRRTETDKTDVFSYELQMQEILFAKSEDKVSNKPDFAGNSNKGGQGQGKGG